MGAEWATIDLDSSTLTIDLNFVNNTVTVDKVVIAKVVSVITVDGATDTESVIIAQAQIEFAIKFET